jgi:hypothetical protein
VKVGDLVELCDSTRRNGIWAGEIGLVVDFDKHINPVVLIAGQTISFHITQVERILNESR